MRILVTGSRELRDREMVEEALIECYSTRDPSLFVRHGDRWDGVRDVRLDPIRLDLSAPTVVVGDCPTGADQFAWEFATANSWPVERFHANWGEFGRAAGPIRNQAMVNSGADVCLAFTSSAGENRGTNNCINAAEAAGIQVWRYSSR